MLVFIDNVVTKLLTTFLLFCQCNSGFLSKDDPNFWMRVELCEFSCFFLSSTLIASGKLIVSCLTLSVLTEKAAYNQLKSYVF